MKINKEILFFLSHQPVTKLVQFFISTFQKSLKKRFPFLIKRKNIELPKNINISNSYFKNLPIESSYINPKVAVYLFEMYHSHRFNLLGSGWVKNSYSSESIGTEGICYSMNIDIVTFDKEGEWLKTIIAEKDLKNSKDIWKLISDEAYIPIDWQKDFKCNFRWNQKLSFDLQRKLTKKGADIKVPWELSRMQHLPQMACFAIAFPEMKDKIVKEFHHQVLDFLSANPYGMGANWSCPMDVGIRAANLLVSYDLLKKTDTNNILDGQFKSILSQTIYKHGHFIVSHLEYSELVTSNHYLSDICGLLFIAAYLNNSEETNCWLAFSIQEFLKEVNKQFFDDGSNFESSTAYHRLSGELFTYGLALIRGLDDTKKEALHRYNHKMWKYRPKLEKLENQPWSNGFDFLEIFDTKLFKALKFSISVTKPNGNIIQIGDNDSGRFFRFSPNGKFLNTTEAEKKYKNLSGYFSLVKKLGENEQSLFWDENCLNHQTFQAATLGYFAEKPEFFPLEHLIVQTLSKHFRAKKIEIENRLETLKNPQIPHLKYSATRTFAYGISLDKSKITQHFYPNFGVYIFKSTRIFAGIYVGVNVACGLGGHSHNDKLSIFLTVNGKDILTDPGTFLYTPLPEKRNQFRKTAAHNVPIHKNSEQESLENGLFHLIGHHKTYILSFSDTSISVLYKNRKIIHTRTIEIGNKQITVTDRANTPFAQNFNKIYPFSNGYGKLLNQNYLQ
ncbi:heparinase II/III domain-containing protein [Maribellus maritimus]|uniref:heparinase II/III domain-containing protein n=1 Tax=Maribellus maritimus TaxID=2870838 RepID=UPI001EEB07E9|nr:heparinase II/III family protein [Maribellus maritimus]MCG6188148.1 heparinase II/III family protein [Maribellus maritimus]